MSFAPGPSPNTAPRIIQGTKPGVLDPTQPARILRDSFSTLFFAAFDPLAASGTYASLRKRAYDPNPPRPKRIVVEAAPGRAISKWRFVPRARRAPGVEDEGVWPRKVDICGEPFILSEDQWDIYKLDPGYDCFVPLFPLSPVITRKDPSSQDSYASNTFDHSKKRRFSSSKLGGDDQSNGINKKFRTVVSLDTDEDSSEPTESEEDVEEEEVEEIMAGEGRKGQDPTTSHNSERVKQRREAREERTKERREKIRTKTHESTRSRTPEIVDLTMEDITPLGSPLNATAAPAPAKRKELSEETSPSHRYPSNKRARAHSPSTTRANLNKKRTEHGRRRMAQSKERKRGLKAEREQHLWEEIFADWPIPPFFSQPSSQPSAAAQSNGVNGHPEGVDGDHAGDNANSQQSTEDAEHEIHIEESRRKLADLEKDKPLWEQEARRRAAQEQAEEEARRLRKEEERLRAAEAAAQEDRRRRLAEAAAALAERHARAEKARIEWEREQRRCRERERWSYGPWTTTRAIERYKFLSEAFDAAKFTPENPVDFELVPWPVLHSPVALRVEDVDWAGVEAFFESARHHMRTQDYKTFVEKSHKRFHPDRWRARGVLKNLADEELRGCLEVAANTVAQALTPIWKETRG